MTDRELFTTDRLLCPGPTPVPEDLRTALTETSLYHRSDEFYKVFQRAASGLRPIFGSAEDPLILACSGSGAMEAAVCRLTAPGDRVVVVDGGKFGERWVKINQVFGNDVERVEIPWGASPDPETIVAALTGRTQGSHPAKALFLQANETSTGAYYNIEAMIPRIRKSFQGLIIVDCISSLGAHPMRMHAWDIDCVVAGSQKGFGLPPGLAFIALSERAWKVRSDRPRFYFDLDAERKGQAKGRSAYTPAINLVIALDRALEQIHAMGVERWNGHHARLANAIRGGIKALGFNLFPTGTPSNALTAVQLPAGVDGNEIVRIARDQYGAFLAGGQDQLKGKIIRIAHLGFISVFDAVDAMACFEWSVAATGASLPLGEGTKAVMQSLAKH